MLYVLRMQEYSQGVGQSSAEMVQNEAPITKKPSNVGRKKKCSFSSHLKGLLKTKLQAQEQEKKDKERRCEKESGGSSPRTALHQISFKFIPYWGSHSPKITPGMTFIPLRKPALKLSIKNRNPTPTSGPFAHIQHVPLQKACISTPVSISLTHQLQEATSGQTETSQPPGK